MINKATIVALVLAVLSNSQEALPIKARLIPREKVKRALEDGHRPVLEIDLGDGFLKTFYQGWPTNGDKSPNYAQFMRLWAEKGFRLGDLSADYYHKLASSPTHIYFVRRRAETYNDQAAPPFFLVFSLSSAISPKSGDIRCLNCGNHGLSFGQYINFDEIMNNDCVCPHRDAMTLAQKAIFKQTIPVGARVVDVHYLVGTEDSFVIELALPVGGQAPDGQSEGSVSEFILFEELWGDGVEVEGEEHFEALLRRAPTPINPEPIRFARPAEAGYSCIIS